MAIRISRSKMKDNDKIKVNIKYIRFFTGTNKIIHIASTLYANSLIVMFKLRYRFPRANLIVD